MKYSRQILQRDHHGVTIRPTGRILVDSNGTSRGFRRNHLELTHLLFVVAELLAVGVAYCLESSCCRPTIARVKRWLQQRFDRRSTAILQRYDHSTTYVTTIGPPVCRGLLRYGVDK